MSFRFLVKDLNTNKTSTVRVRAERETFARQKLQQAGYHPIAMVGVEAVKEQVQRPARQLSATFKNSSGGSARLLFKRRVKLTSLLADYLAPFNFLG